MQCWITKRGYWGRVINVSFAVSVEVLLLPFSLVERKRKIEHFENVRFHIIITTVEFSKLHGRYHGRVLGLPLIGFY